MKRTLILLALLAATARAAPNDFTKDPNCKALWSFENGALTTDSIGGNTLSVGGGSPTADTVNFKEKAASVDLERDTPDYFSIADAALDAKFPLKSGDTNKQISVCCHFKPEAILNGDYQGLYIKGTYATYSFELYLYSSGDGTFTVSGSIGISSGMSRESFYLNQTFAVGQWYHVGVTYQNSDKSWRIRVWDYTASTVYENTGNTTNNVNVEAGIVYVGRWATGSYFDGLIDELVIFNDILDADEIDAIRGGTYGASAVRNWWWRRRHEN